MANFIKGRTKAGSTGKTAEAAHRIVALFDVTMILLDTVVQVLIGPMQDLTTKDRSKVSKSFPSIVASLPVLW
jgi:hypothetical protein